MGFRLPAAGLGRFLLCVAPTTASRIPLTTDGSSLWSRLD